MKRMRKTLDTVLSYRGYHGCPSCCRVRIYEEPEGEKVPPILIATEMESNHGTSVTNRIEVIATEVYRLLERPEAGLTVIEHYGRSTIAPERFALVTMEWETRTGFNTPHWKPLAASEVEAIIGVPM